LKMASLDASTGVDQTLMCGNLCLAITWHTMNIPEEITPFY
jgi:hypothetical protein